MPCAFRASVLGGPAAPEVDEEDHDEAEDNDDDRPEDGHFNVAVGPLEVDDGNSTIKLVDAQGAEVLGDAGNLQLQDKNGQILSSSAQRDIQQNGQKEPELRRNGERYVISPWGLSWDDENYYLVGYDAKADRIKHYRVDKYSAQTAIQEMHVYLIIPCHFLEGFHGVP